MPNRVLRDWTCSEKINDLDDLTELFFVRLIMKADDLGRFHGNAKILKAHLFPLKDISFSQIEKSIEKLAKSGIINLYENDSKTYIEIVNFGQRTRIMMSKFPDPKESKILDCQTNDGQMSGTRQTNDGEKPNQTKPKEKPKPNRRRNRNQTCHHLLTKIRRK